MKQSTLRNIKHVAIIMDGNGRWAAARGLPRHEGHLAGAEAVRRVIEAAPAQNIRVLTLYAFSSDNWRRPQQEVANLMRLLRKYLLDEKDRCVAEGVRLRVIGRRDRLPRAVRKAISMAEAATCRGSVLDLRVAVDYSARDALVRAASRLQGTTIPPSRESFARLLAEASHAGPCPVEVDLLIRTGGEQRLSDFLLWECAYAELYFTEKLWPDFEAADLEQAVQSFHNRERRFGSVPGAGYLLSQI